MPRSVNQVYICFLVLCGLLWTTGCRSGVGAVPQQIRVATYNTAMNRPEPGQLYRDLEASDAQAEAIATVIQTVRPDILMLNEFDYDSRQKAIRYFQKHYLAAAHGPAMPIHYPYCYAGPVNTGIPSGYDLDNDGLSDGAGDAFGYGVFPGQYGMVVLSTFPIQFKSVRTFQRFLWKDMPQAMLPDRADTPAGSDWYCPVELEAVRLSSKSHWDIPVQINETMLHLLVSHPTPPVFDGPEDRNGRRNHDEIRFWADYITADKASYIYDDSGAVGGIDPAANFVILGDLNADPCDGDSTCFAVNQLLRHPCIQDVKPSSVGAKADSLSQSRVNQTHAGAAEYDTYQSPQGQEPGNLRLDYVLPSRGLNVIDAAVFWPSDGMPAATAARQSDHHMVYVDIQLNRS